jgi:Domain of unknown function (DUF4342)
MTVKTCWESIKIEGANILDKLAELLREGNVRRVIVKQQGRTIAEFPLTVGVVGAVFAPLLAAVGAVVALLQDCTIYIEREQPGQADPGPSAPSASAPEPDVM